MVNAFVTLAVNDGYAVGALVLAHSLKKLLQDEHTLPEYNREQKSRTDHQLHVVYTNGQLH